MRWVLALCLCLQACAVRDVAPTLNIAVARPIIAGDDPQVRTSAAAVQARLLARLLESPVVKAPRYLGLDGRRSRAIAALDEAPAGQGATLARSLGYGWLLESTLRRPDAGGLALTLVLRETARGQVRWQVRLSASDWLELDGALGGAIDAVLTFLGVAPTDDERRRRARPSTEKAETWAAIAAFYQAVAQSGVSWTHLAEVVQAGIAVEPASGLAADLRSLITAKDPTAAGPAVQAGPRPGSEGHWLFALAALESPSPQTLRAGLRAARELVSGWPKVVAYRRLVARLVSRLAVATTHGIGRLPWHAAVTAREQRRQLHRAMTDVDQALPKVTGEPEATWLWRLKADLAAKTGHARAAATALLRAQTVFDALPPGQPWEPRRQWQLRQQLWAEAGVAAQPDTPIALSSVRDYDALSDASATLVGHLDRRDCAGWTLLHHAAARGDQGFVERLLKAGADTDARSLRLETPLHRAAAMGHVGIMGLLVAAGAEVEARDSYGRSPLFIAVGRGQVGAATWLVGQGVSIHARTRANEGPLFAAARSNQGGLVDWLLARGVRGDAVNLDGETALLAAARSGAAQAVSVLLDRGADVRRRDHLKRSALQLAAGNGHLAAAARLLGAGADVKTTDMRGRTPLMAAVRGGNLEVVELLLSAGAKASTTDLGGDTLLHAAAGIRDGAMTHRLLSLGLATDALNDRGQTPLHVAAGNGHADVVDHHLAAGADVAATDRRDWVPLDYATEARSIPVMKRLLAAGADAGRPGPNDLPNALLVALAEDGESETRLLLQTRRWPRATLQALLMLAAVQEDSPAAIAPLIDAGADPSVVDQHGRTLLHLMAYIGAFRAVAAVVDAGVRVDARDQRQRTALHLAIDQSHDLAVGALLAANADPNSKLGDLTTLTLARRQRANVIRDRLLQAGATPDVMTAIWADKQDVVAAQLAARPKLVFQRDPLGQLPLHVAAAFGRQAIADMLVAAGAPLDARVEGPNGDNADTGTTALAIALANGHHTLALWLIEQGAQLDFDTSAGPVFPTMTEAEWDSESEKTLMIALGRAGSKDDTGRQPPGSAGVAKPEEQRLGEGKRRSSGGRAIHVRGRWLSADVLLREDIDGQTDAGGPAMGLEATVARCMAGRYHPEATFALRELVALRVQWLGGSALPTAAARHNLGRVLHYQANYEPAERHLRRARADTSRWRNNSAAHDALTATINLNWANLLAARGDNRRAVPIYQDAVTGFRRAASRGQPSDGLATAQTAYGRALADIGRYRDAEVALTEALAVRRRQFADGGRAVAVSLGNLGALLTLLGDHSRALDLVEQQVGMLRRLAPSAQQPDELAIALHNLALTRQRTGLNDTTEELLKRALILLHRAFPEGHYAAGRVGLTLANQEMMRGDLVAATATAQAALDALVRAHGPAHADVADGLRTIGVIALARSDLEPAKTALAQALAIASQAEAPEIAWRVLHDNARLMRALGRPGAAIFFGKQAINTLQALRAELSRMTKAYQTSFVADRSEVYRFVADQLLDAGRLPEASHVLTMLKDEEYALVREVTRNPYATKPKHRFHNSARGNVAGALQADSQHPRPAGHAAGQTAD